MKFAKKVYDLKNDGRGLSWRETAKILEKDDKTVWRAYGYHKEYLEGVGKISTPKKGNK